MSARTSARRWRIASLTAVAGLATTAFAVPAATAGPADAADVAATAPEWWDAAPTDPGGDVEVIVRGSDRVPDVVASVGGVVTGELPLVDGYAAVVPHDRLDEVAASDAVTAVTPDGSIQLLTDEAGWDDDGEELTSDEELLINAAATALDDQFDQLAALTSGDAKLLEDLQKASDTRSEDVALAAAAFRARVVEADTAAADDLAAAEAERTKKLGEADAHLANDLLAADDIARAHLEFDERVALAEADYAARIAKADSDAADDLAAAEAERTKKLGEADAHLANDLEDANDADDVAKAHADFDRRLADAEATYAAKDAKIRAEHADDVAAAEAERTKKLGEADAHLADDLAHADDADVIAAEIAKASADFDVRVAAAEAAYADDVATLRAEQAHLLDDALKRLTDDLDEITAQYAKALAEIEEDYLKTTKEISDRHKALRSSFDSQLAMLQSAGGRAIPMSLVTHETGATAFWAQGFDGSGVDVAVIDSGIAPVEGMLEPGKVVHGPDLSFDSQVPELAHLDAYGHGTHMAGIIGGRDAGVSTEAFGQTDEFVGMAPGSRIVNVKVADATGSVDVSQVIAAIDWVVQHRDDNGLNIRVLNLSFGTDSTQSVALDPLAFAVEQAWKHGIVVVVAAGNDGEGSPVRNPARDPFVIAVGATRSDGRSDNVDRIADFTSCSTERGVDVVAPGRSIVSLRVPGSYADEESRGAEVDERFFKGSGTSQSAAVVSGAVALLLEQRPYLEPDQVKALLMSTAGKADGPAECRGAGSIDLHAAAIAPSPSAAGVAQHHTPSTGMGSLHGARASSPLGPVGAPLEGEIDIFGNVWDPSAWAASSAAGSAWDDGTWNGATWSGATWSADSWSGATWSGATWSGATWSGATWSGATWSGATWSGATWSGATWSGATWSGATWSGATWSGNGWS